MCVCLCVRCVSCMHCWWDALAQAGENTNSCWHTSDCSSFLWGYNTLCRLLEESQRENGRRSACRPSFEGPLSILSLRAWDPPATPALSLPFSSGSAGTSRLPPLLILGCFSELITLSTLLPLKNSAKYKNPVALYICGRADNGSLTRFSDVLVPGGQWADKRASLPASHSSPYPLFWSSFLSSSFPFSVCVSLIFFSVSQHPCLFW